MRYVVRDPEGAIISLHRDPVPGTEPVSAQHPDVAAFVAGEELKTFAQMDAGLVRVLEDLIDALIRRNVLRITDLPSEAQAKLFDRKHFREGMQSHALSLFGGGQAALSSTGQMGSEANGDPARTDWSDLMP